MTTIDLPAKHNTSTTGKIPHPWLWIARAVWAIFTLPHVVLFILQLIYIYPTLPDAHFITLNGDWTVEAATLAAGSLGIPLGFFRINELAGNLLLFVCSLAVGGLILWRKSDELIGLLASYVLIVLGSLTATTTDRLLAPFGAGIIRFWGIFGGLVWPAVFIFLYLFPDGRFVPRWARWMSLAWIAYYGYFVITSMVAGDIGAPPPTAAILAGMPLFLSAPLSQIYRYVRVSGPLERAQIRGVILFCILLVPIMLLTLFIPRAGLPSLAEFGPTRLVYDLIAGFLSDILFLLLPLSLGISILRYRLWDIDFVINRTLVYGGLTLLLGGIFIGGFFGLRALWEAIFGSEQAVIAAVVPAVFVALIFNPTRKWLRRLVDRRLYHIELDYEEAVKVYGGTKREARKTGDTKKTFGAYSGLTLLGRGGMGEVYRAQHPTLKRAVAIKILPDHSSNNDEAYKRFMREAQTIAGLRHPNVITLHDVGEQEGRPYMVMEYIDGQDLADRIKSRGRLPLAEALPILSDVAAALDHAHQSGVIHRDVKPSNVMIEKVTQTGMGKTTRGVLMDFGIAKGYHAGTRLTQSGMIGTLDYISPEQIQGAAEVDARADIYSFGVMAYETLTGELPFKHNNPGAMVLAHLNQPAPDPRERVPDLPENAAQAVMRAMSKKPDQRFSTAGEFVSTMAG